MRVFPFRTPRIETSLQTFVQLQETNSGQPISSPASATIINISYGGACLVVSQPILDKLHLFYDTLNNDSCNLLLRAEEANGESENFSISARSVWMDSCDFKGKPAFKIGISFFRQQKELFNLIKKGNHFKLDQ
ncbi:MAG: hypothetical protein ACN4GW_19440 [Desulforhopalus sp.]